VNVVVAHLSHVKRERLCSALRSRGLQVFSVPDVAAVVEAVGQARISLALVDPRLLQKEDEDLHTQFHRRAGYHVEVVALTNQSEEAGRETLSRHGARLLGRPLDDTQGVSEWISELSAMQGALSEEGQVEPGGHWGTDPTGSTHPGTVGGTGPAILVVEDEPSFRAFLQAALEEKGYRVWTSDNGAAALKFLQSQPVDLVIADVNMPEMDGFELKQKVDLWQKNRTPFVMMTADSSGERTEEASAVGVVFMMAKPIRNLDSLYVIVAEALRTGKSQAG